MLCLAYKLKYNLSNEAFKDHLKIIQIATNSTITETESAAKCVSKYDHLNLNVRKLFVCGEKNCHAILETGKNSLPIRKQKCGHRYEKSKRSCYVLVLPIEEQFKYFLESGGMQLKENTTSYDGTTRGDIQSGDCYREAIDESTNKECTFTLQLNTDGAQCFKKSKFGFWPLMAVINEIPYGARRAHMILMALWFGNKKPPKGPFLDRSIAELKRLSTTGIPFGELTVKLKPLVLTTDSMARTVFLDGKICRGEFGCDFCLHPGKSDTHIFLNSNLYSVFIISTYSGEMIKIGRGSSRVYPEPITNPTFQLRTLEQHEEDLLVILFYLNHSFTYECNSLLSCTDCARERKGCSWN